MTEQYRKELQAPNCPRVESAILCNLTTERLNAFSYGATHFSTHGDALTWVREYADKYHKIPTIQEMYDVFPTIETNTTGFDWDYIEDLFRNQLLYRTVREIIDRSGGALLTEPQKGLVDLM